MHTQASDDGAAARETLRMALDMAQEQWEELGSLASRMRIQPPEMREAAPSLRIQRWVNVAKYSRYVVRGRGWSWSWWCCHRTCRGELTCVWVRACLNGFSRWW